MVCNESVLGLTLLAILYVADIRENETRLGVMSGNLPYRTVNCAGVGASLQFHASTLFDFATT